MAKGAQPAQKDRKRVWSRAEVEQLIASGKHVYLFRGGVYDVNVDEIMHPGGRQVGTPAAATRRRSTGPRNSVRRSHAGRLLRARLPGMDGCVSAELAAPLAEERQPSAAQRRRMAVGLPQQQPLPACLPAAAAALPGPTSLPSL